MPNATIRRFERFLEASERTPATIKNYRCDLVAFAGWFYDTNGDELEPRKVTPTDLREFKRHLQEERNLRPTSVNRKLATLKSFLGWAAAAAPRACRGGLRRLDPARAGSTEGNGTHCCARSSGAEMPATSRS